MTKWAPLRLMPGVSRTNKESEFGTISMEVSTPSKLQADVEGFRFLNAIFGAMRDTACEDIVLNFRDTVAFDPNLCAVIGALVDDATARFCDVSIVNLDRKIESELRDTRFLVPLIDYSVQGANREVIKFRKSRLAKEAQIRYHLCEWLIQKSELPAMHDLLRRCIFEIYNNAIDHGSSSYIYSCGRKESRTARDEVSYTLACLGVTIKERVSASTHIASKGAESIAWAVEPRNTSAPLKYGVPSGFGLSVVREVIKALGGTLQIVSADGYWGWVRNNTVSQELAHAFPGTVVHLQWPAAGINAKQHEAVTTVLGKWGRMGSGDGAG